MGTYTADVRWSADREWATIGIRGRTPVNVVNGDAIATTTEAILDASGEPSLRCLVIEGAENRPFIGGADVAEMRDLTPQSARTFITALHGLCRAIMDTPVPVIAKVRGYALGAGMEVAMACDIRLCDSNARWGMPEVRVGIPSVIEAALLPRLVGWGQAASLLFRGGMIPAREARRIRLVEEVVDPDVLDRAVEAIVRDIRRCGPQAIRLQKRLMRAWAEAPLAEAIRAGIDAFAEAYQGEEPREGMTAFLEKRPARFAAED